MSRSPRRALAFCALVSASLLGSQAVSAQVQPYVTTYANNQSVYAYSVARNNYTGFVGMKFTVGATPIYVTQLGRLCLPGNTQTHTVKLVNATTGVDVPNGSISVATNGADFYFNYGLLTATILLPANTSYLLLSQETAGGDNFYDAAQVSTTSAATDDAAVYQDVSGNYISAPTSASYSYGPVNLEYSTTPPPPFISITSPASNATVTGATITYSASVTPSPGLTITGVQFQIGDSPTSNLANYGPLQTQPPFTLQENTSNLYAGMHALVVKATDSNGQTSTASVNFTVGPISQLITGFSGTFLRNNYTGFAGLEFTTGSSPITVTALGRYYVAGAYIETMVLKLVYAQTGLDVPGGTITGDVFNSSGNFVYLPLTNPLTLTPNTSYLLLSQVFNGSSNPWYDYSPVTPAPGISINGAVYSNSGGGYVVVPNTPNYSYVPVNMTFATAAGVAPGSVTISSPVNNSVFTSGTVTLTARAAPATGLAITSVQFQDQTPINELPANIGPALTTPPYTFQIDSGLIDGVSHTVTAVMKDSGGNTTTSAPVTFIVAADTVPFINGLDPGYSLGNAPASGQFNGMQFTVGPSALKVTKLGFYLCCQFNPLNVSAKLVDAATGLDIPGSSLTFPANYGYSYAVLSAPIILQANKSYYLVSPAQYSAGLYNVGGLANPVATVNFPVYQSAANAYITTPALAGYSYSPLNFEYELASAEAPAVSIESPGQNSNLKGAVAVQVNATAARPLAIASVQLQVDGINVGAPSTTVAEVNYTFYDLPLDTTALSNGPHVLTAIATDSNGTQGTTASVNVAVANSTQSGSASPAFVQSFTPTFLRNNFSGFLGFQFTVGSVPLQISSLGRVCAAGNSNSHTIKLVQASNNSDVTGSSTSVSLSGCTAGQFIYSSLASPITLAANSSYFLVDQENSGADQWYDYSPLVTTGVATINGPVYASSGQYITVPAPGTGYVPLNFLVTSAPLTSNPGFAVTVTPGSVAYGNATTATVISSLPVASVQFNVDGYPFGAPITTAPYVLPAEPSLNNASHVITATARDSVGNSVNSPAALLVYMPYLTDVIQYNGTTLRNNYSGWVGMRVTTGNTASLVQNPVGFFLFPGQNAYSLGRLCSSGNNMLHFIKIVNASTGTDVPNALGWLNMAGCAAGSIVDATMPSNVVLAANTSYYIVSQEVSGGDTWYDESPAVPQNSVSPPLPPILSGDGYSYIPIGANFTIDGPAYTAADGSYVFVPLPNYGFAGLSVGGYAYLTCNTHGGACGP